MNPEASAAAGSALTAALDPLYRAYLRRLDEMAARVPVNGLLREATTRDERGHLVLGADGFARRFDVADAQSGATFEVRSALLDAPAAGRLLVGTLEVELKPGSWEALPVCCRFDGEPVAEDGAALTGLLRAFAELGHHGAFSAREQARPWSGRVHGVQVLADGEEITAVYDLGSAPPPALEVLLLALDGFGRDRAPLAKVIIGGAAPEAASHS